MTGQSGGGSSQTTSTTSGPPPEVREAYNRLVNAASNQAMQPLQQYSGPMVAGFTPQQQQAFGIIGNAQGIGTPYLNAASQMYGQATTPLWPTLPQFSEETLSPFMSPYTDAVTGALTNLYNTENARQFSQIRGDASMRGAYGGDRGDVAQALAAGEQQRAQAPVLADVQQKGYAQAVAEFNQQQQQQLAAEQANAWLASQAAQGFGALGAEAQSLAMSGAQGLLGVGGLQQQLAQSQMNVPFQKFTQTQAYPYQQLGFLAPIIEGTGSLSGGRGSTTTPGPSWLSQAAGLGTAGAGIAGLFGNSGSGSGGNFGGSGVDFEFDPTNANPFFFHDGGRIGHAEGGGIGRAGGGLAPPEIPGVGQGVPNIDLSYIPQADPGGIPSRMGLGMGPQTTTSQSGGGGGGGIGGAIGSAVSLATKVIPFFLADGGRAGFAEGGDAAATDQKRPAAGIGVSGGIGVPGLPQVPTINLDYIIHPGPAIKGAGPPKPPPVPQQPHEDPGKDISGITKALKGSGLFGSGGLGGSGSNNSDADSGSVDYAMGGGVPASVAANFGGAPPNAQSAMQQLIQLPLARLEQMAVQFPPTTQQGKLIAQAIAQKKATVGAGTAPAAPAPPTPASGMSAPPGGMASPMAGGLGGGIQEQQPQQDYGGTAHTLAEGGDAGHGYVTEDELDPHPIIDHSGDTVVVRYPSEGKVLDLGIPSFKGPQHLAAGGSAGAFPRVDWTGDQWSIAPSSAMPSAPPHFPITGPANNAPLEGTVQAPQGNWVGSASPFMSSMPTWSGVAIPQLSSNLFLPTSGVGAGTKPGGGIGDWFQPLDQYQPPGAGPIGPGGSMVFPSQTAFVPQMSGIVPALNPGIGNNLPLWAGGTGGAGGGSSAPAAAQTPEQQLLDFFEMQSRAGGGGGGEKRGGRIGFAAGGDVDEFGMEDYVPEPVLRRGLNAPEPERISLGDAHADLGLGARRGIEDEGATVLRRSRDVDLNPSEWRTIGARQDRGVSAEMRQQLAARPAAEDLSPRPERSSHRGEEMIDGTFDLGPRKGSARSAPLWDAPESYKPTGWDRPGWQVIPEIMTSPDRWAPMGAPKEAPFEYQSTFVPRSQPPASVGMSPPPAGIGAAAAQDYVEPPAGPVDVAGVVEPMAGAGGLGQPARTAAAAPQLGDWSSRYAGMTREEIARITPASIPSPRPSVAPVPFGPGVVRGPDGTLTRNGQPPDTRIAGQPAWQTGGPGATSAGPVTPELVSQAGYGRDPEGYASLANYLWKGEASDFNILYGNTRFSAYDKHPADKGWQGGYGPAGPTHAAGLPQFQPATWHGQAEKLGLADFSPVNQVKGGLDLAETVYRNQTGGDLLTDFKAGKLGQINSALHSTWTSLGSGNVAGPPGSGGATRTAGGPGIGGGGGTGNVSPTELRAIGPHAAGIGRELAERVAQGRPDRAAQIREMWPILAIAAGAGMLASRSPSPGVAIGEGLQGAVKTYGALSGQDSKEEIAANKLAAASEIAGLRQQNAATTLDLRERQITGQAAIQNERIMMQASKTAAEQAAKLADITHKAAELNQKIAHDGATEANQKKQRELEAERDAARRDAQKPLEYKGITNPKTREAGTLLLPPGYRGETSPWEAPGAQFLPDAKNTGELTMQQYGQDVLKAAQQDPSYMTDPTAAMKRAADALASVGVYKPGEGPPKGSPAGTRPGHDLEGNPGWYAPDPKRPGKYLHVPG